MEKKTMNKLLDHNLLEYNIKNAQKEDCIVFSGQLYSSKNSRRNFVKNDKIVSIKSSVSLKQESAFEYQLGLQLPHWQKLLKAANFPKYPLKLAFEIYRSRAGRFDYVNIIQGLADGMVKAGYIEDDSADHLIPIFLPYKIDRVNPRTLIYIVNNE